MFPHLIGKTHGGRVDGHPVKRIRRGRETSKSVLHPAVRAAIATTAGVAVCSRRTIVLLAGTGTEDTTDDGTDNHEDSNWDTDLEPVPLRPCGGARGDVTGGFVVVRVSRAIWSGGSRFCAVVFVICVVVGHGLG